MGQTWAIISIIIIRLYSVFASIGDRSIIYIKCINNCISNHDCPSMFGVFGWVRGTCFWCRYDCMWKTVQYFESTTGNVPQFHGKWPFLAIDIHLFGFIIQEPASVIFSLMNLFAVFIMLRKLKRMKMFYNKTSFIIYAHVGLLTWISSTIFHMFDCDFTEKLDYFMAFAFVLSAFYVSIRFTNESLFYSLQGRKLNQLIIIAFCTYYSYHIYCMSMSFDYAYNMKVCICASLATTVLYLYYLYKRRSLHGDFQPSDILLIRLLIWSNLSIALELLDFVPVFWIFDAHSLFHLATVPIPIWFVDFLEQTQKESEWNEKLVL